MKKFLLLFCLILALFQATTAQPKPQDTSDILWQKYIWPQACGDAKFSVDGNIIYASIDSLMIKLSAKTGDSVGVFNGKAFMYRMDYAKGKFIVGITGDLEANIWDVQQEKLVKTLQYGDASYGYPKCITIAPDDKIILICLEWDNKQNIVIYDPNNDKEIKRFQCKGIPLSIKFSHDGTKFAIASNYTEQLTNKKYYTVTIWDTGTLTQTDVLYTQEADPPVNLQMMFSYDDKKVSTASFFIDINSKVIFKPNNGIGTPNYMTFYPDNIHCFTLYGSTDLWWVNLLTGITEKKYSILGALIDCDKNNNQVIAHNANTLTLLKPSITYVNQYNVINETLKIYSESKKINLELTTNHIGNSILEIIDLNGNKVYQNDLGIVNLGLNKFMVNINLPIGVYFCKIQINNYSISQKFQILN